jgi:hypothetical protein
MRMNAGRSGGAAALLPTRSRQAAVSWCVYFMVKCPSQIHGSPVGIALEFGSGIEPVGHV